MSSANAEIRSTIKASGVFQWQIADFLNMQESALSRKLRKELPEAEKQEIFSAINHIKKEE